jgi:hypothetical protein
MEVQTFHTGRLRVPGPRQSSQGQSGPKPRPARRRRWTAGGQSCTGGGQRSGDAVGTVGRPIRIGSVARGRPSARQIRRSGKAENGREPPQGGVKPSHAQAAEKSRSVSMTSDRPYRIPTPVGRGKYLKVDERSSVKELGKFTPYLRKKGSLAPVKTPRASEPGEGAGSRLKRLFTKNTGLCEGASRRIGADSCPVPEC